MTRILLLVYLSAAMLARPFLAPFGNLLFPKGKEPCGG